MSTGARATAGIMSWARAADDLAARVYRRDRRGGMLRRIGWSLLAAAVPALLWRARGPQLATLTNTEVVACLLGLGLVVGCVLALRWTCTAPRVSSANAAWALDRLARAQGRGLAAAATTGPAASEAAFGGVPLTAPPTVRLLPPHGLLPLIGGILLGAAALLAPATTEALPGAVDGGSASVLAGAAGADATDAEAAADRLDRRAKATAAVRKALNLPPEGPLDPEEVATRLADEKARAAATKAAGPDGALVKALEGADPSGAGLAGLLDPSGDNREEAAARRRAAAAARGRAPEPFVPAARRDVVNHYLQLID